MGRNLIRKDVAILLFIVLALGSFAFLTIGATSSEAGADWYYIPWHGVAWLLTAVALSLLSFILLKGRQQALNRKDTLKTFMESVGDGIFAIDRNFIISLWNRRAEEITGHKSTDVIGRPLREVISFYRERDRTEDIKFIEDAMLYGKTQRMPERMYLSKKDGKEVPVGDSAAPLYGSRGRVIGCIVVFRDATEERKQGALRSEFAYASHQLKTPVTKALWSLEAAMDKPSLEKKDLKIAINSLHSIRKLSREIVDVAEIDQNIVKIRMSTIDINELLAEAEEDLKHCREDHNATIEMSGVPAHLVAQGDARLVRRALTEIVCNAITFGKSGGKVTISAEQEPEKILIEVRDEGPGIIDKEQSLVFSKFFRGSNLDTTSVPGAGLGMFIAKSYIELSRGHIWFRSAERVGSTFSISLRVGPDIHIAKS